MTWQARVTTMAGTVVAAGLLATACSGDGGDDRGEGGGSSRERAEEAMPTLEAVQDLDQLRRALWEEGTSSSLRILGLDGTLPDSPTVEDARVATDGEAEQLGSPSADGLPDDLSALRAGVDQRIAAGTASLADLAAAEETVAEYQEVLERVGGEVEASTLEAVDDPRLREGVELLFGTGRIERRTDELVWRMISSTLGGGPGDPAAIQDLASVWSDLEAAAEEVRAAEASPYREVVDARFPTGAYDTLGALVEGVLDGGQVDIAAVIDAGDQAGTGYDELGTALAEATRA